MKLSTVVFAVITTAGVAIGGGLSIIGGSAFAQPAETEVRFMPQPKAASRVQLDTAEAEAAAAAHLLPNNVKSLLSQGAMQHGEYAWNDDGVPQGKTTVWVDVRRQTVSVFRAGHEIGTAVILYGKPGKDTPLGTFPVLRKVADYHSRTYDAPMPHSLFITNDGVALHGSNVSSGRATHGCIGLPPTFAELLFAEAKIGTRVTVVHSDAGATAQLASID